MMKCISHEHTEKYIGHPLQKHDDPIFSNLGWTKICHPILPQPNEHISETKARFKYIDDFVAAEAVSLCDLTEISHEMEKPLAQRDRTLHQLPDQAIDIQKMVKDIDIFCKTQQMIINEKKTKTVVFNTSKTKDFYPRLKNTNNVI